MEYNLRKKCSERSTTILTENRQICNSVRGVKMPEHTWLIPLCQRHRKYRNTRRRHPGVLGGENIEKSLYFLENMN